MILIAPSHDSLPWRGPGEQPVGPWDALSPLQAALVVAAVIAVVILLNVVSHVRRRNLSEEQRQDEDKQDWENNQW